MKPIMKWEASARSAEAYLGAVEGIGASDRGGAPGCPCRVFGTHRRSDGARRRKVKRASLPSSGSEEMVAGIVRGRRHPASATASPTSSCRGSGRWFCAGTGVPVGERLRGVEVDRPVGVAW